MKEIYLSQGKIAIIDDEDFDRVNAFKWCASTDANGTCYACRWDRISTNKRRRLTLHRFIINAGETELVDHRNGDTLDCRRSNLRLATRSQNQANRGAQRNSRTGLKGVVVAPNCKQPKWIAQISYQGSCHHLGTFDTPEKAAHAYDVAAKRLHGEFANTNFLGTEEK